MSVSGLSDIGGTFTDVVVETAHARHTKKVLTTPRAPEEGVMAGVLGLLGEAGLSIGAVEVIIRGTTLATNAIIERTGAATALSATDGVRDSLAIADEGRYDQYDINIEKPTPLVPRAWRFTVPERMDVDGRVRRPLEEATVIALVPRLEAGNALRAGRARRAARGARAPLRARSGARSRTAPARRRFLDGHLDVLRKFRETVRS
jgi:N-methylhydantoinase A